MAEHLHRDQNTWERTQKGNVLIGIVSVAFLVLVVRLFFIQVITGEDNLSLSIDNRVKLQIVQAPRGIIYDRYGKVLADNRPSYMLMIQADLIPEEYAIFDSLMQIRDEFKKPLFDSLELVKLLQKATADRTVPSILKEDISDGILYVVSEHLRDLPGVTIETLGRRAYPYGAASFHVIGYMGDISEATSDSMELMGYQKTDRIGKYGLEGKYETDLRGSDGWHYVEVNAFGRQKGVVADMPQLTPVAGNSLHLSIDAEMQRIAHEAFDDTARGALIALNPKTGEILAMVSNPSIDPNVFSLAKKKRASEWGRIIMDTLLPLNNRCVDGTYPPASTFKLITALALIDQGLKAPTSYMNASCGGYFRFGNRIARCWDERGHGHTNVYSAIKYSCNVYFYQAGLMLGDSIINLYAQDLGLGGKTGVDLPSERGGFLSGKEAFNERFKSRGWTWTEGLILNQAIGQAQITTPMQLAVMAGALGNGKERFRPTLLKKMVNGDGVVVDYAKPQAFPLRAKSSSIQTIKMGMSHVVDSMGGTGSRARVKGIPVGGKTGSAENPHGEKTHALFVGVAPLDNPEIAIVVVLENVGGGGANAAPIAGTVLNYYFDETPEGQATAYRYRGKSEVKSDQ